MQTTFHQIKSLKAFYWIFLLALIALTGPFAKGQEIKSVEIIKSLSGNADEAIYFYENNWKEFRQKAIEERYINDFEFLVSDKDSFGNVEIMLLTVYESRAQFDKREENFRKVMNGLNRDKAKLKNEIEPGKFRQRIYSNSMINLN